MKKLFFATCAMGALMFVACTTEEASLVGTWNSDTVVQEVEEGVNGTMNYQFELKEDSTLKTIVDIVQDMDQDGVKMTLPVNIQFEGKWRAADGKLITTPIDSTISCKLITDSMKMSFENKPEMEMFKDKLVKAMKESFDKELGMKMTGEFAKTDTVAYVLEGDVLKLISKKDTITLKRAVTPEK